jgi:dTDP-4-amino-4,6-dideoxygalactose transaminase
VHLYGRAADLAALSELCTRHRLALVEDCAQAHGAFYQGQPVGSIGSFGAWSFYPTKNLGAIGDAGAITSNDPDLIASARQLRNYGQSDRYYHEYAGLNSRLDELQAAILQIRLPFLQAWTERRRAISERYWTEISNPRLESLAKPLDPLEHVHHLFVMKAIQIRREEVQRKLAEAGITTLIHYPVLCHQQQAIAEHRIDPMGLPLAINHSAQCFSLPIDPFLQDSEVDQVIEAVNSVA